MHHNPNRFQVTHVIVFCFVLFIWYEINKGKMNLECFHFNYKFHTHYSSNHKTGPVLYFWLSWKKKKNCLLLYWKLVSVFFLSIFANVIHMCVYPHWFSTSHNSQSIKYKVNLKLTRRLFVYHSIWYANIRFSICVTL